MTPNPINHEARDEASLAVRNGQPVIFGVTFRGPVGLSSTGVLISHCTFLGSPSTPAQRIKALIRRHMPKSISRALRSVAAFSEEWGT